jgi:mono/diheme cytochrome c family protein
MPSRRLPVAFLMLLLAISVTGCSYIGFSDSTAVFITRYKQYLWGNIPAQYVDVKNPLPASTENIALGKMLYQTHCQVCHGASAGGNGPAAAPLHPHPSNLAVTRGLPLATDSFFFWTVAEGGQSLGTAMPAWGGRLSDKEIWLVIHYIKQGTDIYG